MSFYEACEYCPLLEGQQRIKTVPFGNREGEIVVVVPHFARLTDDQKSILMLTCPEAYFIGFPACANVEDVEAAELVCGVLLRNESRRFRKFLIYDSETLRGLFHIVGDSLQRDDGVKFSTYKGRIGEDGFKEEYQRLNNNE